MNTWVKIVGVTAIVGAAVFLADKFNQAKNTFSVKFKSFGLPTVSSAILTVPIDLEFFNTTGITISIPDFLADIYIKKNGQWINAGIVQQPIQLQPNLSQKRITPSINLRSVFGSNITDTATSILNVLRGATVEIKVLASGTANGIPVSNLELVPPQTLKL